MKIRIADSGDVADLLRLYHFLSSGYQDDAVAIFQALRHPATTIFVVELDGRIVGTATLSSRVTPCYGLVAWIDDVVVDPAARGHGVARRLMEFCLDLARKEGCKRAQLTSGPARQAANALYQKLGFSCPRTNFYSIDL